LLEKKFGKVDAKKGSVREFMKFFPNTSQPGRWFQNNFPKWSSSL
jgi:hypothetical protein